MALTKRIWECEGDIYKLSCTEGETLNRDSMGEYWQNWVVSRWLDSGEWQELTPGESIIPLISMTVEYEFVELP